MAENPPNGTKIPSWEEQVMNLRSTLKMTFSNFNDDTFLLLDSFFKMSLSQNAQFEIILAENSRLAKLCEENKIDTTPPKIITAGTSRPHPITTASTADEKPVKSKQSI